MSSIIASALAQHREAVERRTIEVYADHGYTIELDDGRDMPDIDAMKAKVFEIVSSAYAARKEDKSKVGLTNGELYAAVFPDGPGARSGTADGLDDVDAEVRKSLMRALWQLVKATPDGYVQRRLDGNVLVRSPIVRDRDLVSGVYVTDDPQLLLEESLM